MNSIIKFVCATAIAATSTSALFTATAHAQAAEVRSMAVETADLNLETATGQERLNRRIDRAAKEVCGYETPTRDLSQRQAISDCVAKTRSNALAQVRSRTAQPLALQTAN